MTEQEIQALALAWRKAEDRFYQAALNMPEVYADGIRLVRALASSLEQVVEANELVEVYQGYDLDQVGLIADKLALAHGDFIDFELARDAAFYLRYQEILDRQDQARVQARLAEAQAQGAQWVTLYDNETRRQGRTFFQRLEMRLPDGLGLYTAVELDLEKGRVYVVEPIMLDPATGDPRRGVAPPDPREEFRTREELAEAVARLREKYSVMRDA
ncbi:MAG: hypothetical protein HS126_08875 [Anaerolineales bacterium]|nr:hypothetical protein [Anaerolineales bacterium]